MTTTDAKAARRHRKVMECLAGGPKRLPEIGRATFVAFAELEAVLAGPDFERVPGPKVRVRGFDDRTVTVDGTKYRLSARGRAVLPYAAGPAGGSPPPGYSAGQEGRAG